MGGFWDDPAVKPANGEYMRFENVGDRIEGTIASLGKRKFDDDRVAVEIKFREDDVPTLTAGQVLLQKALFDFRPAVGDRLAVELAGVQKKGTKTLKLFKVDVVRADGSTESVNQAA